MNPNPNFQPILTMTKVSLFFKGLLSVNNVPNDGGYASAP